MKKSLKVSVLATAIVAVFPSWVGAAGLGGINVFSALGQPLRAEIELNATVEELDGMVAVVPGMDAFRQANLSYSPLMSDLTVSIERHGQRPVLRLSSDRVINEPFLDVLVEVSWASGRLVREYTFLLDPPEMRPVQASAGVSVPVAGRTPSAGSGTYSGMGGSGEHTVRRGETLHRIANDYLPQEAQLEQMLIALLRANPEAFADGNINRLRADSRLVIPDEDAVASISVTDARREVLAQGAEFSAYRSRIASAVASRPATAAAPVSREQVGAIKPRVEDVVRDRAPMDQVQVSGAPPEAGSSDVSVSTGTEEDLFARERELLEEQSRNQALMEAIEDLQRERELERSLNSERIARLESQVAELLAGGGVQERPASSTPPAPTPAPVRAPAPAPATQPVAETGFFSSLMANPLLLAAGAVLLGLLALIGVRIARRRKDEWDTAPEPGFGAEPTGDTPSVVSVSGGETVDTDSGSGNSVLDSDFSQTGLSAIDADEGVDPVAEADVYLAYGRDAQAEEILLDALKVDAARHAIYLKLLEVYVQRGDRRQFEVIATDLYSRTGGEGSDWQKAIAMGRKLDPDNPLYSGDRMPAAPSGLDATLAAGVGAAALAASAAMVADQKAPDPLEDAQVGGGRSGAVLPSLNDVSDESTAGQELIEDDFPAEEEVDVELSALDFDLDAGESKPDVPAEVETSPAADMDDLSFDLDLGDAGEQLPASKAEASGASTDGNTEESTFMDLERTEFDANLLDFDLDLSPPAPEKTVADAGMDLSSVDLELDTAEEPEQATPEAAESAPDGPETVVPHFAADDLAHEMDTKLELARAYDEMGDREGARELLEEVIKEGAPEQREAAERMLERLA